MRTLSIVKNEILCQADHQFAHRGITVQIHVLMLDAAPEPLDEDVGRSRYAEDAVATVWIQNIASPLLRGFVP